MSTSADPSGRPSLLKVFCSLGVHGVLVEATKVLQARGLVVSAVYESTKGIQQRLDRGERADVVILLDSTIEQLIQAGVVMAGSRRVLAKTGVAIAVQAGAAKPDISTVEAFKRALLAAPTIAYTRTGASGIHFASLIDRLGIADDVNRKARVEDGLVGELAARGEVTIAIQQMSELKPVGGIDIVGQLPAALQKATVFSAGVFVGTAHCDAANELLAFFYTQEGQALIVDKGLEPISPNLNH